MVKEVALPLDPMIQGYEFFPIGNDSFHSGLSREGDNGMQVIRHEKAKSAMPDKFLMVVCRRRKNCVANIRAAELVLCRWFAINRNEEPTTSDNPLGHRMG